MPSSSLGRSKDQKLRKRPSLSSFATALDLAPSDAATLSEAQGYHPEPALTYLQEANTSTRKKLGIPTHP